MAPESAAAAASANRRELAARAGCRLRGLSPIDRGDVSSSRRKPSSWKSPTTAGGRSRPAVRCDSPADHRHVAHDGGQVLRHHDLVVQRLQQVALLGRQLVQVLVQLLDAAELRHQLRGGLVADARHARDVVRRVAAQRLEVRDRPAVEAVSLAGRRRRRTGRCRRSRAARSAPGLWADQLQGVCRRSG